MRIPDGGIRNELEAIQEHFSRNLYHQALRRVLSILDLNRESWQRILTVVDGNLSVLSDGSTASLPDVYETIIAFAAFSRCVRRQICGNLRDLLGRPETLNREEKMLRDITLGNFESNLEALNTRVINLYWTTVRLDKKQNGTHAVAATYQELRGIESALSGGCRASEPFPQP